MRNILKGRLALVVLVSVLLVLSSVSAVVYANGISGKDIATEQHFHLSTDNVLQLYDGSPDPDAETSITGNLFTFTHPGTPDSACIVEWDSSNTATPDERGNISGSFVIDKSGEFLAGYGYLTGTISISFDARSQYVPHIAEFEPDHYNFSGPFKITGGTGFYEGIKGSGTISGTFHDHAWGYGWGNQQTWFDFVMIGKAKFPGH